MCGRLPVLFLALLTPGCTTAEESTYQSSWLYVIDPLEWNSRREAYGDILILEPSGKFAAISPLLYKEPDERLAIIYPEGYIVVSGTWKRTDDGIAVRYRGIHSTVVDLSGPNQPFKKEVWTYASAANGPWLAEWIETPDHRYVPLKNLDDLEALRQTIQFHRNQAQAKTPK